jgi:hypothetical protein
MMQYHLPGNISEAFPAAVIRLLLGKEDAEVSPAHRQVPFTSLLQVHAALPAVVGQVTQPYD